MMTELVKWLTAQLDEDERIAQQACEWPWTLHPEGDKILRHNDGSYDDWEDEQLIVVETHAWSSQAARDNAAHVIRWEPSRVVADVTAKRRILAMHEPYQTVNPQGVHCRYCCDCDDEWPRKWPCETLRLLASAYKRRDGYRTEWGLES